MLSIKPSLILILLSITTLISCSKEIELPKNEQILRPVKTMVLASVDRTRIHEFTAVVDAVRKADLSFKVSGELAEFYVKQGDHVAKGDVLAKLNDTDILIQVKDAQSQFNNAVSSPCFYSQL
jgi:multidrug efflux pump subunit AcrA (membrane-fusion protein)